VFSDRIRSVILCASLLLSATAAYAQDAVDQKRIEEAVREAETEAAAFAAEVAARAEAYAEEARALTDSVHGQWGETAAPSVASEPVDLDAMVADAGAIRAARQEASSPAGVLVFVSFSIPEESLRQLVLDAHRAEVPVLLQGFVGGSLKETATRMRTLLGADTGQDLLGGVVIDPRAFRIFRVTEVPAFLATSAPLPDCDGLDCAAPPPPHDRIAGNMSLGAALSALASEGIEAVPQARAALTRWETRP
jgi:conjugal transfer pilus assembly protein TrbC